MLPALLTTLLFAGVNADQCVLCTLQDANFHGYDCMLLRDCAATTSPDYCMAATVYNVNQCFGFVLESSVLAAALALDRHAEVVDHDLGPVGGEQHGLPTTDTPATPGDDRDLAVEQTHGALLAMCGWRWLRENRGD